MATKIKIGAVFASVFIANKAFEPADYERKNWVHRFTNMWVFPVLIPTYKPTEDFEAYQLRLLNARSENMKRFYVASN